MSKDDKTKELRQAVADLDKQISECEQNKRDASAKLREMDESIRTEYASAVDEVALSEVVDGPGALNRILTSKAFQPNHNLRLQREKVAGGLDALCKRLKELVAKRKQAIADLTALESKSAVLSLHEAKKVLLDAIAAAEAAHRDFNTKLSALPVAGNIAGQVEIDDPFFISMASRRPPADESLVDFISWAVGVLTPGNPLYGGQGRKKRGESDFHKQHLFKGVTFAA